MATITFIEGDVALTAPMRSETYNVVIFPSGVLPGHALYQRASDGAYGLASATVSGTAGFRGIALTRAVPSGTLSIMVRGRAWGYDLSAVAYDALVYLGNVPGTISTVPVGVRVPVGRVKWVNEAGPNKPKVIHFDAEFASDELG